MSKGIQEADRSDAKTQAMFQRAQALYIANGGQGAFLDFAARVDTIGGTPAEKQLLSGIRDQLISPDFMLAASVRAMFH